MKAALLAAILLLVLIAYGCVLRQGSQAPRLELEVAREQIDTLTDASEAVSNSSEVSRQTAARVDIAGADIRQRATQARERILEHVEAEPVPAGDADPIVMHEASEAYAAAIRATCRVQRTSDCPAAAASSD